MYRDDVPALQARLATLDSQLVDRTRERDEVALLLAEAQRKDAEARAIADRLAAGPEKRRRRRIQMLVGAVAALLVTGPLIIMATRESAEKRRHREFAETMVKFQQFADAMCACHDTACAQGVSDQMTMWAQEMAKNDHTPPKLDEAETKQATELGERMGKCMVAAMTPPPPQQQQPQP